MRTRVFAHVKVSRYQSETFLLIVNYYLYCKNIKGYFSVTSVICIHKISFANTISFGFFHWLQNYSKLKSSSCHICDIRHKRDVQYITIYVYINISWLMIYIYIYIYIYTR